MKLISNSPITKFQNWANNSDSIVSIVKERRIVEESILEKIKENRMKALEEEKEIEIPENLVEEIKAQVDGK